MKKFTLSLTLILFTLYSVFGDIVNIETAEKVAQNFINQSNNIRSTKGISLAYKYEFSEPSFFNPQIVEKHPIMYVFNIGDNDGIIFISGDDIASPVLGYSVKGKFEKDDLPYSFRKWLEGYKDQIMWAIENEIEPTELVSDLWKSLIKGESLYADNTTLAPLCSTTWNQSPYYNAYCPGGSVTGCVATAMAQVMKYWNHPAQGSGMHSYNHDTYGTISADFGSTTYQWSQMPNSISSSNDAIATLMYHCGVSVDMNYSPEVSGAWVVEDDSPVCSESAFKNYFGYSSSLHGEKREWYSTSNWLQMLYSDLDAGRPLVYAGFGSGGGHAFVCDGYDAGDYFHFNWGWGGYYDGYFHIDALDPGGTGTGGGTGGYNTGHQAIFGMVPENTSTNTDIALYSSINVSPSSIMYGDAFSVGVDIANYGSGDFSGDFAAWVFDGSGDAVEYVNIINTNLSGGYYNTYNFSTSGMSSLLPGSYTISMYYRPNGGNWIKVGDGDYYNSASLSVENESNDISLYSTFSLSTNGTITQGEPFSVFVDIINNGNSTFYGSFNISLYDLDGYWIETIQTLTGAALDPNYYYADLEFNTNGVSVEPGTYYLALQHQPTGGEWEVSGGSSSYPNPIEVIVKSQGIQADSYEPNNDINSSSLLSVNFSGNMASVYTTGSNIHNGSDYDYYTLNLPSGYDYSITARAQDSYSSNNGQTYTGDVLWSYNNGNFWSLAFDDVMPGTINVSNGGSVTFLVASYFLGETGTYLMDIQINRSPIGIDEFDFSNLAIYPNPAKDELYIASKSGDDITKVIVTDMLGNEVYRLNEFDIIQKSYSIDVSTWDVGTYIVSAVSGGKKWNQKFVKIQ
jgi:hypothetical protein